MAVYRFDEKDKAAVKRNPLNRGSCSYLPKIVYDLEKTLRQAENVKAFTLKERDTKAKIVAAARDAYEQKLEILNLYKECFPDEFNTAPIKKPE